MKPVQFNRLECADLNQAATALQQQGNAKYLGGGQSLGPMLNLRLARPETLIDLAGIEALRQVREDSDCVQYGAAICHAAFEDGLVPDATGGMLRHVAAGIAYRAVRNRGTIGGSLAHADPAADWVNVMLALDASIEVAGTGTSRSIAATAFMQAAFTTALLPGEIIASVRVPRLSPGARWGYYKVCRKPGEFSEASGTVVIDPQRGYARIVLGALDGAPVLLETLADTLAHKGVAAAIAATDAAVGAFVGGMPEHRRQLFSVAVRRALQQLEGKHEQS
ncbi:FAD binding domain-containing protein [Marinobacterium rhizophilum]|uniref:FAD binding domain-containing protein n=1 Tax=Marinobacterium rhizophilum TaxID=420402 RepID=A0ABY5HG10_9GAMM|nr:FAD binding domain-containing protein [Marinobacterium rhizophilum]UTW11292.1 FAD binding domain-containing protein [Marinobacterium rhizophilum]